MREKRKEEGGERECCGERKGNRGEVKRKG